MKKILFLLLLVSSLCSAQVTSLTLPYGLKMNTSNRSPLKSYLNNSNLPYTDAAEVLSQNVVRHRGQKFFVSGGIEYWFKDGIADGDLVVYSSGGSVDTTAFIKTQGTSILTTNINIEFGTGVDSINLIGAFGTALLSPYSIVFNDGTITGSGSSNGYGVNGNSGSVNRASFLDFYQGFYDYRNLYTGVSTKTSSFIAGGAEVDRNKLYWGMGAGGSESTVFEITSDIGDFDFAPIWTMNFGSDATGDIYYRNSSGKTTRLGVGTNGHVLTLASGLPSWAAPSGGGANALGTYLVQTATNAPANAQVMASLATGIVKNTTTTGVQSIAVAADFPTLNQNTTGNAATVTTNANLTGDVTSTGNATAIASGVIVNADINASAAIGATKLIDGSITDTELGYINTLSSNAQTQITAREVLTNKATDLSTFNSTLYPTTASLFARRDVTGTDAIVQADNGKTIYFNSGSPFNFTIDAITTNSSVYFYNKGSATVTFVDGSGVTSTGVTSLAAGESGGIIYESSTTPIILGTPSGGGGGLTVGTSTITSGTNGYGFYNNSGVLGEFAYGTGVRTWLTTPSWTNFNSAITGTAPFYSLASGGTATGTNTFAMGSNPFILTSGVTTGTGATAGIQNVFNSLTTGNGLDISTSSLTSGKGLALTSTSTAINHTRGTNALFSSRISGANANSTRTAIAGEFVATNTGTSSTNTAVYAAASGGTNNYSIYASGQMYVEGIASSGYVAYFKASGVNQGVYVNSTGQGVIPIQNNTTDLGNTSQQFKNAFLYGNIAAGGITTVLARIHSRGAGTTTGYNILTENSSATARFGVRDNGAIEFSGSAGTSGYLLQSNGATSPPTWVAPTNTNVQANVTNYKYSLVGFTSGTSGSLGTPVTSAQLANGESVTIVVHWSAMDGDSNTGAGGTFITTWTKSGGTLNKVMDLNTGLTGSDTGDALAVSSSDSGGDILISLGTGTIAGNMKASGIAEVTINK